MWGYVGKGKEKGTYRTIPGLEFRVLRSGAREKQARIGTPRVKIWVIGSLTFFLRSLGTYE